MDRRKIQRKAASLNDELYTEKQLRYVGRVKILLSNLRFFTTNDRRKQFANEKAVKKLVQNFASEEENLILALISEDVLNDALQRSNLTTESLHHASPPPKLMVETATPLKCLYGRNRLQAARRLLEYGDDWLIVDLYSDESSLKLQTHLQEGYANSTYFCDGEILRHIRLYQDADDILNENKWWARLSQDKKKDLKRVLNITEFRKIFDELMDITGLWPSFHIGTFRRYLVMNCHEELLNYLQRIYRVWSMITGGDKSLMRYIDVTTVEALELRAPKASNEDARLITDGMRKRELFRFVQDPKLRHSITQNILQVEHLIPSLRTFCEDTKYLEPCANAVKLLLRLEHKETVDKALRRIYKRPRNCFADVQKSEDTFTRMEVGETVQFHMAKIQIFLAAFRNFNSIVNVACRKDTEDAKPMVAVPNQIVIYQFAMLANRLGFNSDQIQQLLSTDPFIEEIYSCLIRLDPSKNIDDEKLRQRAQNYTKIWNNDNANERSKRDRTNKMPLLVTDENDQALSQRCGRPFQRAHIQDKQFLFLPCIYSSYEPIASRRYITSFYVKRAIFLSFFGELDTGISTSTSQVRNDSDGGADAESIIDEHMTDASQEPRDEVMEGTQNILTAPIHNHDVVPTENQQNDIEMEGTAENRMVATTQPSESILNDNQTVTFHEPNDVITEVPFTEGDLLKHVKTLPNCSIIFSNQGTLTTLAPLSIHNTLCHTGSRQLWAVLKNDEANPATQESEEEL